MTVRQTIYLRRAKRAFITTLLLCCILDYARVFGYPGDDWRRFNGITVMADQIIDHRTFRAGDTTIRLLGIAETPSDGGTFLRTTLTNHPVRLALDQPQTRDEQGRLLAAVFLSPADCVNVAAIYAGSSMDRTTPCALSADLEMASIKAKRKTSKMSRKQK